MRFTGPDLTGAVWSKSSFSGGDNGDCVEVAFVPGRVGVRDSKQHGRGPVHAVTPAAWSVFLAGVRSGALDPR